jgi:ubiquinone/menaquinone biosynthesis C-methylase UbiE
MEISKNLQDYYNNQYVDIDSSWRELAGKTKFDNILKVLTIDKIDTLAEVGAGEGSILMWLDKANICNKIWAFEISDSAIQKIKARQLKNLVDVIKFDGYKIPFEDNFFDLIICSHVIEHVEYPRLLLREIKRVSKFQVFEVPIDFSFSTSKKVNHFLSYGHINIYTPDLFDFLLKSEGFEIINQHYSLYSYQLLKHIYKEKPLKLFLVLLKVLIIKLSFVLRKIKPQAYTVMTRSTEKQIKVSGH